jgi:uncharacterized protein YdeI (BOF family)
MKNRFQSTLFLSALVSFLSVGISLSAQQAPQTQPPDPQSQQPTADQPAPPATDQAPATTQTPPAQTQDPAAKSAPDGQTQDPAAKSAPDAQAQTTPTADTQSFTGTIVKSGDKYVFQDAASGNTYDIDHQDEVQKFEGKKVKVHGKLDESGKTIHVQ